MARLLLLVWSLGPMLWQLYTSFRPSAVLTGGGHGGWTLEHYEQLLNGDPSFLTYLLNSGIVGLSSTALTLLLAIPCAYALSRMQAHRARNISVAVAAAAAFPAVLLFLALLEVARDFHLANNLLALSLPYAGLCLPPPSSASGSIPRHPRRIGGGCLMEGMSLWQRLRWCCFL